MMEPVRLIQMFRIRRGTFYERLVSREVKPTITFEKESAIVL